MKKINVLVTRKSEGYELIDSGDGEKLERFGSIVLSRPDPQSLWKKNLSEIEWKKADAVFTRSLAEGKWKMKEGIASDWIIDFAGLKFNIKPTAFKHTGLFPEQSVNWEWMRDIISKEIKNIKELVEGYREIGKIEEKSSGEKKKSTDIDILNLFGYTGGASLACAQAGAHVVHVDGSKSAITWARENAEISGLKDKPIRWILEDARVFVGREIKRGNKYDAVIMDPPAFGHGANKEIWKIEEHFLALVDDCISLLKDKPLFFIINGYSAGYSAIAYENVLKVLVEKFGGEIEVGELVIEESGIKDTKKDMVSENGGRLLPCGISARWTRSK